MKLFANIILALGIVVYSCTSEHNQNTKSNESSRMDVTQGEYQVGQQLASNTVCMVNNTFMGKPQIPVLVNGKTYYGCCQMCVATLTENDAVRIALDPFTGENVDKSDAFIVLADLQGTVSYFQSEETSRRFLESKK